MRRVKLLVLMLVFSAAMATAQTAYQEGQVATSISAASATGVGTSFSLPARNGSYPSLITWTMTYSGTPSAISVTLEGSLDNSNWFTLDTSTQTAGEMRTVDGKPVRFVRCNIGSYTVNSSTATCKFIAGRH